MKHLTSALLTLSLLASSMPAIAADTTNDVAAPSALPCEGSAGKARARCITDALKAWKILEHDYSEAEDDEIAAWKAEHAAMGAGSDYQKLLRDFLNGVHARRKEFRIQLTEFRKAFFAEQTAKREEGDGRKGTEVKLEKSALDAAKAICGVPDDDGAYRLCMRIQLRTKTENVDRRSRTNSKVMRQP